MLRLSHLGKKYNGLPVIDQFDLDIEKGSFSVLIGPSGCGKSTLFDLLTGTIEREYGTMEWIGEAVPHLGQIAAYMQQKDLLLPWLSLMQNAMLPQVFSKEKHLRKNKKAKGLFERFGLNGFEDYLPGAVSGGMKQRCALIRTLMFEREIVLLDEPLSALDAITRRSLQSLLLSLLHY